MRAIKGNGVRIDDPLPKLLACAARQSSSPPGTVAVVVISALIARG